MIPPKNDQPSNPREGGQGGMTVVVFVPLCDADVTETEVTLVALVAGAVTVVTVVGWVVLSVGDEAVETDVWSEVTGADVTLVVGVGGVVTTDALVIIFGVAMFAVVRLVDEE